MKTIQVLDRPEEIAALLGAGFTLLLSNGQEIILQVRGEVADLVSARQARNGEPKRAAAGGRVKCDEHGCEFMGKSAHAIAIHLRKTHGIPGPARAARTPGKGEFPCGMNGCFGSFTSARYRERHWEKAHAIKS